MMEKLNTKLFDHTILKADATKEAVLKVCREAKEYNFMSVCVNGFYTALVKKELEGTDVKVCTVVGFPLRGRLCEDLDRIFHRRGNHRGCCSDAQ